MSTDWNSVCMTCKRTCHLGQYMGCRFSFGFGSNDEPGRIAAGQFVNRHIGHDLRIMLTDNLPTGFVDVRDQPERDEEFCQVCGYLNCSPEKHEEERMVLPPWLPR